jgi:hypothetical protein
MDTSKHRSFAEASLVLQVAVIVAVAASFVVAVWFATGYALDWLGAPTLK